MWAVPSRWRRSSNRSRNARPTSPPMTPHASSAGGRRAPPVPCRSILRGRAIPRRARALQSPPIQVYSLAWFRARRSACDRIPPCARQPWAARGRRPSMNSQDFVMAVNGEAGEGVVLFGDLMTQVAARSNIHISSTQTFPAEVRGGRSYVQIRYGVDSVFNPGDKLDIVVAFDRLAYHTCKGMIRSEAILLVDGDPQKTDRSEFADWKGGPIYVIPMTQIAAQQIGEKRSKNIVALGAVTAFMGFPPAHAHEVAKRFFEKRRSRILEKNLAALDAGREYVEQKLERREGFRVPQVEGDGYLVMSGNDAIALGALYAGCRFLGGYPITPASEIMQLLAELLPEVGGTMYQAEDEIASLAAVLGASYSGVRAMTATSGPGLSLMSELLGLSGIGEIPVVIVDVQRGGPSTGMPTKTEQSDLGIALHGGHGEFPRVVMAPISIRDCFQVMRTAFEIAERYQVPVIVLSEQGLAHRRATLPKQLLRQTPIARVARPIRSWDSGYVRYMITDSGISPRALPGDPGGQHQVTGLEHWDFGGPSYEPANRTEMVQKRFRKLRNLDRKYGGVFTFKGSGMRQQHHATTDEEAGRLSAAVEAFRGTIGIIGWGATAGVVREAVARAEQRGIDSAAIFPRMLFPHNDLTIRPFIEGHQRIIVVEENYTGQYARFLNEHYEYTPTMLSKYDGLPFTPEQVLRKIEEVADHA
ncbi:MAG: 2-oxoacid:acceptor oxidoreductase subunit alpha [Candidatus Eisenbacteria bacterium]|nr:2-oxoacid:acceptor oxidoreductase subunit alpha [Candidatus Eisenbacteria bacterium]